MDLLQVTLDDYLSSIANGPMDFQHKLLAENTEAVLAALAKTIEEDPNRDFTLRVSSAGRPLCQLQMERMGAERTAVDKDFPVKMLLGGTIEALFILFMKEAGIKITSEQEKVVLPLDLTVHGVPRTVHLKGTLDIVIDDGLEEAVWDIKSASSYSYTNKFRDYDTLKQDDTFGYIPQLFAYAKARGVKAGGWLVVNKETGESKFVRVPEHQAPEEKYALGRLRNNITKLLEEQPFERCFSDVPETFYKKETGRRVLQSPCKFCPYKYSCWEGVEHLPKKDSKAVNPPYEYYTKQ